MRFFSKAKLPCSLIDESLNALLQRKKDELKQADREIQNIVTVTKTLTSDLIGKLRKESSKVKLALYNTLDEHYAKGVVFIASTGNILFANKLITDKFNITQAKLSTAKVEKVKLGKAVKAFSDLNIHMLLSRRSSDKQVGPVKVSSCFTTPDDVCTFILSTGDSIGPFNGEIVLLDPTPKTVGDAVFIIYIDDKKEAVTRPADDRQGAV